MLQITMEEGYNEEKENEKEEWGREEAMSQLDSWITMDELIGRSKEVVKL